VCVCVASVRMNQCDVVYSEPVCQLTYLHCLKPFRFSGGSDHTLRLWEVGSGKCIAECVGHSAPVTAAEFSADDKQVVSVGLDACVLIWNVFSLQSK